MANSHWHNNTITSLVVNGNMTDEPKVLKDHVVNFYKQLYCEEYQWRPKMNEQPFNSIDVEEKQWMEREFKEGEVWEVVRNLEGDKAPGPDGFLWGSSKSVGQC
jgi:hypothetical protein